VIIRGVAEAMNFAYSGVDFECSGQIDVRGPKGIPGIQPYFEKVVIKIVLHTAEPANRIKKLQDNVEFRCPVMNLLRLAGVELGVIWHVELAE